MAVMALSAPTTREIAPASTPTRLVRPAAPVLAAAPAFVADALSLAPVARLQEGGLATAPALDIAAFDRLLDREISGQLFQGNNVEMFIGGPAYHAALKESVAKAERSIALVTHTFDDDATTNEIVDILIAKAKAGLIVAVIIDWYGATRNGEQQNIQRMRDAGIQVKVMKRVLNGARFPEVTHSKITLIDGAVGFVGGQNFSGGGFARHDLTLRVSGPVLPDVQAHFLNIWQRAGGGPLNLVLANPAPVGNARLRALQTTPKDHAYKEAMFRAIDGAKREINLEQAYMMDRALTRRLVAAAKRGVTVRVIIPVSADEKVVDTVHRANLSWWMKAGIEVYRFKPSMHTKSISVDGVWATVGSTNANHRGLNVNYEMSLALSEPALVRQLDRDLFEKDLQIATRVTPAEAKQLRGGLWQRVKDRVTNWIVPHFA